MTHWLFTLFLSAISVFLVTELLPSVHVDNVGIALGVAAVYGILKVLLRWILVLLTLPFMVLTLGLFWFVINAFLLALTDRLIEGFRIDGFLSTIIASILISLFDTVLQFWARK